MTNVNNSRIIETVKEFDYEGYKCLVKRNPKLQCLLGYIKFPKSNIYHRVDIELHGPLYCPGKSNKREEYVVGNIKKFIDIIEISRLS